jgi:hypothetical protein
MATPGRRPPKPLPLGLQLAKLRARCPGFEYRRGEAAWYGPLQPTPTSPVYTVKLAHCPGGVPRVWVIRPALHPEARSLHRYGDGSLCLYYPDDGDWRDDRFLADTIVPWAAEWLFFYACWLIDPRRRWLGPEAPHGDPKRRR